MSSEAKLSDEKFRRELLFFTEAERISFKLSSPTALGYYLTMFMSGFGAGHAYGILFNKHMCPVRIISLKREGKRSPRYVLDSLDSGISLCRARYLVLVHNHYNNPLRPSPDDILTTDVVTEYYRNSKIKFLGHYIVSNYDYILLTEKGETSRKYTVLAESADYL